MNSIEEEVETWLDAVASLIGAKSGATIANVRGWRENFTSAVREDFTALEMMDAVRLELERNREAPQFFGPGGVLKQMQLGRLARVNASANGRSLVNPKNGKVFL
ncbi:MAG: hypothetical protein ACRD43_10790 [Pyrinomonadaceae bacterium]